MSMTLNLGVDVGGHSLSVEFGIEALVSSFQQFSSRVLEVREAEVEGFAGAMPQYYYTSCPHCGADATFLGSKQMPDRKVRMCLRCHSYFEVNSCV